MAKDPFLTSPQIEFPQTSGSLTVSAPSNIALVKYWGKSQGQIPKNASISFTLDNCLTQTTLSYTPISTSSVVGKSKTDMAKVADFEVFVAGQPKPEFAPKIATFFERIKPYVPWISSFHWRIDTKNTFPHGSGIASSASGFAALAGALMHLEARWYTSPYDQDQWTQKTSFLARLGSGSAARSVLGPLMYWGKHPELPESNDLFACPVSGGIDPVFADYQDTILLVDQGEKEVSSTVGHNLMHDHPYALQRFEQAQQNLTKLLGIMSSGDVEGFCQVVETEALSLHAMMMTSNPSYLLMKPNTLAIIDQVRLFRRKNNIPVCFTLDAGANVHLLYPKFYTDQVMPWVKRELSHFCQGGQFIDDQVGHGVKKL
jgi:diphosphomevalonate decarboxylase